MEENIIDILSMGIKKKLYNNGDSYEVQYVKGKREGKGKYFYKNGDKYEGNLKMD